MYTTEYDLIVAQDRSRAFREEMRLLRLAQSAEGKTESRPSLLDRLITFTSRGAHVQTTQRNGAAA
jgi:hypothetical protein